MRKLLVYLRENTAECVLAPLFKLLEAVFELLVPLIMARLIDQGIGGQNTALIYRLGLYLLGLAAVGLVSAITAQYFAARAATGFSSRLKSALFRHIYALSFKQTDSVSVPTLITCMTGDVNQVQSGVNLTLRLLLRSPFIVFGAMIMAFTVDVRAALVFAVVIPLLSASVALILYKTLPGYRKIQRASDAVLGTARENLTGVRVIRAFGREDTERALFDEKHGALTALQLKTQKIAAALNPLTLLLINAALAVLIHVGAVRVDIGALSQGQVVALTNYMSQILVELVKLANLLITLAKSLACAGRIESVLSLEPDMRSGSETPNWNTPDLVCLRHVSVSYEGEGKEALKDVSLTLKKGGTLGVIGGTGSGKSTLAALISRFYDATKGDVLVGGQDVRALDTKALRDGIGVVPQKALLFRGTIRSNLLMGKRNATDGELTAALKTAQALPFVEALPEGLDAPVEQGGRNFSGGQRQRLTIARALVRRPHILVLDDSASALDAQTDSALRRALARDVKDTAVVIISQRASSVMNADQIVVLEDGAVAGLGTHDELLQSCPVYRETYEAQFPKEATRA